MIDDWYVDCFATPDEHEFPVNSYGPCSRNEACLTVYRLIGNELSGIDHMTITQQSKGCSPAKDWYPEWARREMIRAANEWEKEHGPGARLTP